jgi:hypothetical protein
MTFGIIPKTPVSIGIRGAVAVIPKALQLVRPPGPWGAESPLSSPFGEIAGTTPLSQIPARGCRLEGSERIHSPRLARHCPNTLHRIVRRHR